jgi:hypothetical protein
MARLLGHRQTKGTETDKPDLRLPRHISTLQITLLNLGRNFAIKQEDWPVLCRRIEQLLHPQEALLPLPCTGHIESAAQRYAGQLIVRAPISDSAAASSDPGAPRPPVTFAEVDIDSLQVMQPRSVGVEHVGLHALTELGIIDQLRELGVNGVCGRRLSAI